MKIFNGIYCCTRDNPLVPGHVRNLDQLGHHMSHWLYYGMGAYPLEQWQHTILGVWDRYENLPLKTYCMFRHALETCTDWTHFFKTDVNAIVDSVKWDVVAKSDLAGYVGYVAATPKLSEKQVSQPALAEQFYLVMPEVWVGGPAYTVSRRLAQAVVNKGIWWCRQWPMEDVMVAYVAKELGFAPQPAIGYIADDGRLDVNK